MKTPAKVPSDRAAPGKRKTTMWEKLGADENANAYWVGVILEGLVRTGLPGRMSPKGGAVDILRQGHRLGVIESMKPYIPRTMSRRARNNPLDGLQWTKLMLRPMRRLRRRGWWKKGLAALSINFWCNVLEADFMGILHIPLPRNTTRTTKLELELKTSNGSHGVLRTSSLSLTRVWSRIERLASIKTYRYLSE